jgi:hypothetical protein
LEQALARKRCKLRHITEYTHAGLAVWVKSCLPVGWTVFVPPPCSSGGSDHTLALAAQYPKAGRQRKCVIDWLRQNKCPDAEDEVDGACSSLAILLSARAASLLGSGIDGSLVPRQAQELAVSQLRELGGKKAASHLFGLLASNNWEKGPSLWGLPADVTVQSLLYGTDAARDIVGDAARTGANVVLPLYVLTYIFDGDELGCTDMKKCEGQPETGQYSCHVVGLVLDQTQKCVVVSDPNGGLLAGGNMEFVKMPLQSRDSVCFSTSISQFDLDSVERAEDDAFEDEGDEGDDSDMVRTDMASGM